MGLLDWFKKAKPNPSAVLVHHQLKTWAAPFESIRSGAKRYEIRKDDRGFGVGQTLVLFEWLFDTGEYTGRFETVRVIHITRAPAWGLPEGMVVMGFEKRGFNEDSPEWAKRLVPAKALDSE